MADANSSGFAPFMSDLVSAPDRPDPNNRHVQRQLEGLGFMITRHKAATLTGWAPFGNVLRYFGALLIGGADGMAGPGARFPRASIKRFILTMWDGSKIAQYWQSGGVNVHTPYLWPKWDYLGVRYFTATGAECDFDTWFSLPTIPLRFFIGEES